MFQTIEYLKNKKIELVDNCERCGGKDLSCQCYQNYFLITKYVFSGIPLKYIDAELSKFSRKDFYLILQEYIKNYRNSPGLFINGETELKTEVAVSLLKHFVKDNQNCKYVLFSELIENLYNFVNFDCLLIDNLGLLGNKNFDFVQSRFYDFLLPRINNLQVTIITSRFSFSELGNLFGKQLKDYLKNNFVHLVLK